MTKIFSEYILVYVTRNKFKVDTSAVQLFSPHPVTGRSKGYAFIGYKHAHDAEEACHVRDNFMSCFSL